MKFRHKLMIEEYKKAEKWGGDLGPSEQKFAERLILPKIKKAKSKKDLDKIYNDMMRNVKRGHIYTKSVINIVKSWFEERAKELGIKESYIIEAPIQTKGWTKKSLEKFGKTIGKMPGEKGFFDACVKEMAPKEGFGEENAKGFCASIKDAWYDSPNWRGKGKTKKEVKKDVKKNKFKKEMGQGK